MTTVLLPVFGFVTDNHQIKNRRPLYLSRRLDWQSTDESDSNVLHMIAGKIDYKKPTEEQEYLTVVDMIEKAVRDAKSGSILTLVNARNFKVPSRKYGRSTRKKIVKDF